MEINVIPFLDYAISLLAIVITAVVGVVGKRLNDRFKLEIEYRHREVLQEALGQSVLFAVNRARAIYKDNPPIKVRNNMVSTAFKYIIRAVPDALKKFGIDPNTTEGQKRILEMLETRLDSRVFNYEKDGEVVELKDVKKMYGETAEKRFNPDKGKEDEPA